tara:strand:- start:1941 stop:3146 length:1206 start_codon:yes stop_codon:yes gene_type:complete
MPNNSRQIIEQPRLYVSYPLWQYSQGQLTHIDGYSNGAWGAIDDNDLIKILHMDPSDTVSFNWEQGSNLAFKYGLHSRKDLSIAGDFMDDKVWDFNYAMILNHNLHHCIGYSSNDIQPYIRQDNRQGSATNAFNISSSSIVNFNSISYDGFSIFSLDEGPSSYENPCLRFGLYHETGNLVDTNVELGTIMWGKYFDFPSNAEMLSSVSYEYGISDRKTVGGVNVPKKTWTRVKTWANETTGGTEPFGLRDNQTAVYTNPDGTYVHLSSDDSANNFRRKSGKRVWKISFDSFSPEYVMNQNPMLNEIGWSKMHFDSSGIFQNHEFNNYETDADGSSSFTIDKGVDFYTNVIHRTNGGQIPMVLQVSKDVPSPENFAIVKMSDYSIIQKTPNLYSFTITLREQ